MIKELEFSHIGQNSKLQGTLRFFGKTQVEGMIHGDLIMEYQSPLSIGIDAEIQGNIFCHDIEIYGSIMGNIESSGKVILYPSSDFHGQLICKKIEIMPGANVNISGHAE